ncbi:MAG: 6-phosphogluconolactonase [Blastocatellia bacterium]
MEKRNSETIPRIKHAVIVASDARALAEQAAAEFLRLADEALNKRGVFLASLSGGSTPGLTYEMLAASDLDFARTHFFICDERDVPPDNSYSNYRFIREHLLGSGTSKTTKLHRWLTEKSDRNRIATEYQSEIMEVASSLGAIAEFVGGKAPRFDVVLLGIGSDGHTASLFPRTDALTEMQRLAVPTFVPAIDQWRFTLTFPALNNARHIIFLAAGKEKAETIRRVIKGEGEIGEIPALGVRPISGNVTWFIDLDAAAMLDAGAATEL